MHADGVEVAARESLLSMVVLVHVQIEDTHVQQALEVHVEEVVEDDPVRREYWPASPPACSS